MLGKSIFALTVPQQEMHLQIRICLVVGKQQFITERKIQVLNYTTQYSW